ncbi:MAG: hypothetical protein ACRDL3_05135 [Solirubrobacterales bacterium]
MRGRVVGLVALVAVVAIAAFAAQGFGGEGPQLRSLDPGYSTQPTNVHRVASPSAPVNASALAQASKKRKPQILFFETEPVAVPGGGTDGAELDCPQGKVVTGYFLNDNTATFLGLSAPASRTRWAVGVTNTAPTPTQSVLGIVCAKNVK